MTGEIPREQQRILDWMREQGKPVLFSEMREGLGIDFGNVHHERLRRAGHIEACFPECIPGKASGRQFWRVVE